MHTIKAIYHTAFSSQSGTLDWRALLCTIAAVPQSPLTSQFDSGLQRACLAFGVQNVQGLQSASDDVRNCVLEGLVNVDMSDVELHRRSLAQGRYSLLASDVTMGVQYDSA